MIKICIKDNEFNPSLLSQNWCNEEKAIQMGFTIVEAPEDSVFEDFNNDLTFNIEKYNARKLAESNAERIIEIKARLNELSQDFIQVQVGAEFDDLEERKEEFRTLHNELRELLGKEPRIYNN